jgi:hypothetical protein
MTSTGTVSFAGSPTSSITLSTSFFGGSVSSTPCVRPARAQQPSEKIRGEGEGGAGDLEGLFVAEDPADAA